MQRAKRRGKKKFLSGCAGAQIQHQNQLLNPGVSKSSCPINQETQRIFIWYLPCVPRANQLHKQSPERAGTFPALSLVSRVNADYPGSYHLHNPDPEQLQLFQTAWLIPSLQTKQPVGMRLSDVQQLLPGHGNGEFLAKPLHMCVQENRKFRQSISTGSKGCGYCGSAGMERGGRGGGKGVGGKETLSSTWGLGIRQGRGCAGVNSRTYTG